MKYPSIDSTQGLMYNYIRPDNTDQKLQASDKDIRHFEKQCFPGRSFTSSSLHAELLLMSAKANHTQKQERNGHHYGRM